MNIVAIGIIDGEDSLGLVWGDDHSLYLMRGEYAIGGDNPLSLLQIWENDSFYWNSNIIMPRVGEFNQWKGDLEEQIITLFSQNPQEMVRLVAEKFPPTEDLCKDFDIEFIEGEDSMIGCCSVCGRMFEDDYLHEEHMEAMLEMHMENQMDAYREERLSDQGGESYE